MCVQNIYVAAGDVLQHSPSIALSPGPRVRFPSCSLMKVQLLEFFSHLIFTLPPSAERAVLLGIAAPNSTCSSATGSQVQPHSHPRLVPLLPNWGTASPHSASWGHHCALCARGISRDSLML